MINKAYSVSKIIDVCCYILIGLIFFSKVSLKWTMIVPYSIGQIIFQHGLHPFINIALQSSIFSILIFYWARNKSQYPLNIYYRFFIYSLIAILSFQTFCQITMVNLNQSILTQLSGLIMAILLMLVYGVVIPSIFSIDKFVKAVTVISRSLVILSFIFLPIFFPVMFRGGRFVGFFKHIPHMVTASTVAFIFFFPKVFKEKKWTLKSNTFLKILGLIIIALCVILTSTKAAFITILITTFFGIFLFGSKSKNVRLFKFTFLASVLVCIILLGAPISQFAYNITTGKVGFGMRPAQDGIATRMEEVFRGIHLFEKSPYFGNGLMFKYSSAGGSDIDVDGYNSFKDPHNLFISAGVVGGYPLMIISIFAYLWMVYIAFRSLLSESISTQVVALFLLSHLPVFIIYHAHFSLGGMGDRIYWLIFGYLAQSRTCLAKNQVNIT